MPRSPKAKIRRSLAPFKTLACSLKLLLLCTKPPSLTHRKPSSDPKYAPGLNLKVLRNSDGSFVSPCYDTNRQPFDIEKLEKGQNVTAIINIASIWVIGTKFGVSVRLEQLRVTPSQKLASYAFIDDEEEVSAEFLSEDEM